MAKRAGSSCRVQPVFFIISQFWAKVIFCYGVKFCAAPLTSPPGWYIVKATSS